MRLDVQLISYTCAFLLSCFFGQFTDYNTGNQCCFDRFKEFEKSQVNLHDDDLAEEIASPYSYYLLCRQRPCELNKKNFISHQHKLDLVDFVGQSQQQIPVDIHMRMIQ